MRGLRSELKDRVAQKIIDEFERLGFGCILYPGDFRTADGFWRRCDVYRWQIYVQLAEVGGNGRWDQVELSSWDTLTACGRHGIEISFKGHLGSFGNWEADAKYPKKEAQT